MPSLVEPPSLRPLTRREFEQFRQLARETIGLDLRDGKEPLVAARLGKVAGRLQLRSYQEYYDYVLADRTGQALLAMIEALTTHHTGFLREPAHFEFLAQIAFSEWRACEQIRIWSAGCSIAAPCPPPESTSSLQISRAACSTLHEQECTRPSTLRICPRTGFPSIC